MTDLSAYAEFATTPTAGGELSQLSELAVAQAKAELAVKEAEAELDAARAELRDIAERQIPELMDAVGLTELKTASGLKIEVAQTIRASIPKAEEQRAFAWLRSHGHAALIKRTVSLAFGKGEDDKAEALREELARRDFEVDDKMGVHPSTLASFVKTKLEAGEEIPLELFGVHRQRVSKLKF